MPAQLVDALADPNLTVRMMATNRLADVVGKAAVEPLKAALARPEERPPRPPTRCGCCTASVHLDDVTLSKAAGDAEPIVRVHAMRILADIRPGTAARTRWPSRG